MGKPYSSIYPMDAKALIKWQKVWRGEPLWLNLILCLCTFKMLNLPFTETLAADPLSGIRLSLLLFCTYLPEEYNLLSPMRAIVHTRCCSQLNLFLSWIFHSSLGGNQNREVSLSSFINVRDAQVPSYPEMDIKPSTKTTKPRMTFDY